MVQWRRKTDRIGESGYYAEIGDIVEVVKGRKFPIGMKMVVAGVYNGYPKYVSPTYTAFAEDVIMFYDEGFKKAYISIDNVRIIATEHEGDEYKNVHEVEVLA